MIQIGDVVEILSGYAFKSNLFNESGEGLPLVRIRDVGKKQSETYYSGEYSDVFLLNNGDFIIGMDGDFRLAKWEGGKALLNQRVCKITPNKEKIDPTYLFYILPKELKKIEDVTSFATVKHLSAKDIKAISIPLPPLDEQQKIAAILDAADSLRQKDQQLVERYTALSQSLFLEMFENYIGGELTPLKFLVNFSQGIQFALEEQVLEQRDGYTRFLRIIDFTQDSRDFRYVPNCDDRYQIKSDDIVIVRYGASAGFVGTNKVGVLANNLFKVSFDKKTFNSTFMYHLFKQNKFKKFIENEVFGAAMPALSFKVMERYEIPVPPISIQNQFAERIQLIEAQKQQAQRSLEKSEALFNSLLQRAFTGELTAKMAA